MLRNLQTLSEQRNNSWFEHKLLLIRANPSHNNYQCLCETASCAPAANGHIKSRRLIKAGMLLIRRATLEADISGRLNLLLDETKKALNLTLSLLLITFAFHQMAAWFDLLHLGTGLETWFTFLPWQKAHQGLMSDVVWENATSAWGMLASPVSKGSPQGQHTPTYTWPCSSPAVKKKSPPFNHFKAQRPG